MPLIQLIPSLEDREFTLGPGHWSGDQGWDNDPFGGHSSYITLTPSIPLEHKVTQLNYPYIKPLPGKQNIFGFVAGMKLVGGTVFLKRTFSDGSYSYVYNYSFMLSSPGWTPTLGWTFNVPGTWNIPGSFLSIEYWTNDAIPKTLCLDSFSLTAWVTPKIQYLPIIGVG